MGRPLNKKYFGNRNIGSASTAADNGIGGGAVASVTLNALGSYTTRPTITFAVPTIPGGVRATGTITSEVVTAAVSNGLTGEGYEVGDLVTFTGITGVVGYVAEVGSGVGEIQSITFTQEGTSRGEFTTLPADLTDVAVIGGEGTLSTVNISFRAKAVVITEPGSGYASAPTPTFTQSVTATSVNMLVDSGAVGTVGNQENAIQMVAFLTGGSAGAVDIIRQVSTRRYKVTDGTRTGIVTLTATEADAAGEGSILATDADGGTYYVTKLTGRKATLTRGTGTVYTTGVAVPWTFGTATATVCKIANA
jgi:hypothetical protein